MVDTKRKISAAHARSEALPAKRQRVSRACDQCRLAREKCDGIQPVCFTCASSNRACSYTASPKKRGIQPGYIRTLELALAWSFANIPGVEDGLKQALQDGKTQVILSGKDIEASNKLHRKWRRSLTCKSIDRLLSGSALVGGHLEETDAISEDDEDDNQMPPSMTTDANLLTPVSQPTGNFTEPQNRPADRRTLPETDQSRLQVHSVLDGTSKLKLPDNIWRLFDIYFNYTHSWLPIVEKHDVLKITYSYPVDGVDTSVIGSGSGSGDHAVLWTILALASIQESSCTTSSLLAPTATSYKPSELLKISNYLIFLEQDCVELGRAQALLLHSLSQMASSHFDAAWLILGQAIRIALLLDATLLSTSINSQRAPEDLNRRIRHVLLGCFVLETLLSTHLRKPPMLNSYQLEHLSPVPEDSLEEWHPWEGCVGFGSQTPASSTARIPSHTLSIFNQLSKLTGTLNEYVAESKLRTAAPESGILPRLDQWLAMLPPDCVLNLESNPQLTPQKLSLHIVFQCIAASFGLPHEQQFACTEIVGLLERFTYLYGDAAVPSFFPVLFNLVTKNGHFDHLPSNARQTIASKISTLRDIWSAYYERRKSENGTTPVAYPLSTATVDPSTSGKTMIATDIPLNRDSGDSSWIGIPFASPSSTGLTQQFSSQNIADTSSIAATNRPNTQDHNQPPNTAIQSALPTEMDFVDTNQLQRFNSVGSLDLDALFDDIDGPERANTQPQFMQNLGFAPGADLTDILASDYGQFDPLLTAYMSGNTLSIQSSDPSRIFDPG